MATALNRIANYIGLPAKTVRSELLREFLPSLADQAEADLAAAEEKERAALLSSIATLQAQSTKELGILSAKVAELQAAYKEKIAAADAVGHECNAAYNTLTGESNKVGSAIEMMKRQLRDLAPPLVGTALDRVDALHEWMRLNSTNLSVATIHRKIDAMLAAKAQIADVVLRISSPEKMQKEIDSILTSLDRVK